MTADFSDERISAYLDGELGPAERAELEALLATSAEHRQLMDELRALRQSLQDLPRLSLGSDFADRVLRRATETAGSAEVHSAEAVSTEGVDPFESTGSGACGIGPAPVAPSFELEVQRWRRAFWSVASIAATLLIGLIASNVYWLTDGVAFQPMESRWHTTESQVAPGGPAEFAAMTMMDAPANVEMEPSAGNLPVPMADEQEQVHKMLADTSEPGAHFDGRAEDREMDMKRHAESRLRKDGMAKRDESAAPLAAKAFAESARSKMERSIEDRSGGPARLNFGGGLGGGGGGLGGFGAAGNRGSLEASPHDLPPAAKDSTLGREAASSPANSARYSLPGSRGAVSDQSGGAPKQSSPGAVRRNTGDGPPRIGSPGGNAAPGSSGAPAGPASGTGDAASKKVSAPENKQDYRSIDPLSRGGRAAEDKPGSTPSRGGSLPAAAGVVPSREPAPPMPLPGRAADRPAAPPGPGNPTPPKGIAPPPKPADPMNVPAPPGVVPAPPEGGPANGAADAQIRLAERFRQPNEKVQRQLDALVSNLAAANPRFVWVTLTPEVSDDQVAETLRKNILASSTPRAPTSAAETGGTGQPNLRFNLPESTSATGQVLRVRGTLEQMEQVVKELRDASASVEWIVPASTVSAEPEQDRSRQSDAPANSEESSQRTVEYFHKLRNPADKPQSRSAPSDYFVVLLRAPTGVNAGGATASPIPPDAKPPAPSAPVPAKPAPPAPSPKPGDP